MTNHEALLDLAKLFTEELCAGNKNSCDTGEELLGELALWLRQLKTTSREAVSGRIRVLLSDGRPRRARGIAAELGLPRRDVNGALYSDRVAFRRSAGPVWSLVDPR